MILDVQSVYAGYGKLEVLHGVSLHVNEKEIVCVMGPNGAGKSTLLNVIAGGLLAKRGRVTFDGHDITNLPAHEIPKLGLTFAPQGRKVFRFLSVGENLEMGAYILKEKSLFEERIKMAYDLFPILNEKRDVKAGFMSGGEQKMLEFARALMLSPKLLMLDEPSLGLSPKAMDTIFDKVKELNQTGVAVLMVEQNAYRALPIADRGYVLELGRVAMEGASKELIDNPEVERLYFGG